MKAGWKTVKLGEVCSFERGLTYSKSDEADAPGITVLRANNVDLNSGQLNFEDLRYIHSDVAVDERKYLSANSIIVCTASGSRDHLGKTAHISEPPRMTFGGFMGLLRPHGEIDSRFLFYLTRSDLYRRLISSLSAGTNINNLKGSDLLSWEIPLPTLVEQKRIVALLDEAFAGIDEAKDRLTQEIDQVNSLLQSKFNEIFAQPPITFEETRIGTTESTFSAKGRKATSRNIAGSLSLCVGKPSSPARSGWRWIELSSLAQLESGHTPSRAKQEYWNGNIPWISIRDAKKSHGKVITDTEECITDLGVENSSARILPTNTVCLSRTASVGYCTITGRPMATSQDFVNWVIKGDLHPSFLKFIFLAEGDQLLRFASGSVHQTIYYPETKAFAVCIPNLTEQVRIARHLEELTLVISQLRDKLANKQVHLGKLKSSMLAEAFAGELTA